MSAEAKVRIGLEGAAEAERALKKLSSSFESWGKELGSLFAGTARELGHVSGELARVDPGQSAQKFRDYRGTITEFAIATKRNVAEVKAAYADLSRQTILPDDQIASTSSNLAKLTYDFSDSSKALASMRAEGLATNRSLDEMIPIAETLHNSMGQSFSDIPEMLGNIRAAADTLGVTGGPAALEDEIASLGSTLSLVSIRGKKDAQELVAVLASFGKGMSQQQQAAVQQSLLQKFTSGGEQLRLNLGIKSQDFYDKDTGGVKITAANIEKLRDFYVRRAGGDVGKAQQIMQWRDPRLAAALFRGGLIEDMRKAEGAAPSTGAQKAMDSLRSSQHGVETAAQQQRDQRAREETGAIVNAIQQGFAKAMPQNSIARYFTMGLGGGLAGSVVSSALTKGLGSAGSALAKSLFSVAAAGDKASLQLTGLGGVLKGIGGVAAAGAAGYAVGSWIDKKTGLSSKIANALDTDSAQKEEAGVAANKMKLLAASMSRGNTIKDLEGRGMSHGQALYYAEHRSELPASFQKTPDTQVQIKIVNATGHPVNAVEEAKGKAGAQ